MSFLLEDLVSWRISSSSSSSSRVCSRSCSGEARRGVGAYEERVEPRHGVAERPPERHPGAANGGRGSGFGDRAPSPRLLHSILSERRARCDVKHTWRSPPGAVLNILHFFLLLPLCNLPLSFCLSGL